jgi:tetratricopeptide (TPR) repeat protein
MKVKNCSLFFCWLILLNSYIADLSADEETLDALFLALKYAPDETTANVYVNEIWHEWFQSGDETIDGLMQEAMRKRRNYDFAGAIEILNKVIETDQSYPEAWNQRATVRFHQQKYEASLEDIAETLVLEPRHFGALAGRAVIRLYQSKSALARQNIIEASKIHPYLKERAFFPDLVQ